MLCVGTKLERVIMFHGVIRDHGCGTLITRNSLQAYSKSSYLSESSGKPNGFVLPEGPRGPPGPFLPAS